MQLGDKKLVVQRASVGAKNPLIEQAMGAMGTASAAASLPINIPSYPTSQDATEVLCLMNMVTPEELQDDEEYESRWSFSVVILYQVLNGWSFEWVTLYHFFLLQFS